MQYMVIGSDGNEYGPADFRTLQQWAADSRLTPGSRLRDMQTGQELQAGSLPDLFPQPAPVSQPAQQPDPQAQSDWSQAPTYYAPPAKTVIHDGFPWRILIYSALGLVLFFAFQGLGLIFAGFAVYYAIGLKSDNSKWAPLALGVSILSLVAILIGLYFRFSGG